MVSSSPDERTLMSLASINPDPPRKARSVVVVFGYGDGSGSSIRLDHGDDVGEYTHDHIVRMCHQVVDDVLNHAEHGGSFPTKVTISVVDS
jgi:hypothetical protein